MASLVPNELTVQQQFSLIYTPHLFVIFPSISQQYILQ